MASTGTVKWYNSQKRFGFIVPDEGGKDIFVHATALEEVGIHTLDEGQRVQYDLADNRGRMTAVNIKFVD